ncbi:integrase core domain-containing protein [Phycicoccus sp. BSK3Z-2]|uniref:Integrase core domain-containing protein n=1 Tax=Phycicoccus avicenniae TaxID=2828860 RepID=A0A941HZ31_9MICO|nr:integrase core domain-containing protein [Phycicoccus avicenniae]
MTDPTTTSAPTGTPTKPRRWRLATRPTGWPTPDDFELAESSVPDLADGQIRVRNTVLSVDPYMRGRMSAAKSYAAPYEVGEAMTGGAVGVVEESRADGFAAGDHVLHGLGWREVAVVDESAARTVDVDAPESAYLGDSYDNALAEAFNSLFKAELVRNRGPWKNVDDREIAVAEYIDWFNYRRLHGEIGMVPPAEHEENH